MPFFEILTVEVSTFSSKVNLKQTNVMSWMHNDKSMLVILYILLCCFDLELDTVASLPEGDLKSMKY